MQWLESRNAQSGLREISLSGHWRLRNARTEAAEVEKSLQALMRTAAGDSLSWNCDRLDSLDSAGAMVLWRLWGRQRPLHLCARPEHLRVFDRLAEADARPQPEVVARRRWHWLERCGDLAFDVFRHSRDIVALIGQIALDMLHVLRHPRDMPWREISATLYKSGARAMPVTALVGFLIGIVLSYLSALQLRQFGADIFIVNILGLGIVRELGPVLVATLVAGRSGSAMTAQLGVMRVTEEIDALATMGVSRSLRLVLPKVLALGIAMPLLVLWATAIALIGGMISAYTQLDISFDYFIQTLPRAVPVANLWIGLGKGAVFGLCIGLVACHFGLRVRPNTESLSANTTASVVTAITLVIVIDAIFAIATRRIGLPI